MRWLKVLESRIVRLSKLTCVAALAILLAALWVFGLFGRVIEYFIYMTNIISQDVSDIILISMRFGVAFIVLGYYIYCIMSGEWDLNYKLIIRKRLREDKYSRDCSLYLEEIKKITIRREGQDIEVDTDYLRDPGVLERQGCYFCKINEHTMAIRDLKISDRTGRILEIRKYKFLGKPLLVNNNLYGYEWSIRGRDLLEEIELNSLPKQEADIYLENAYIKKETNIKDSFKDDMKDSLRMLKTASLCIAAAVVLVGGYKEIYTKSYKTEVEANGIIVTSNINKIKVIFDSRESTELMPYVNTQLAQINSELLDKFNNEGWKIRITATDMNEGIYFGLQDGGVVTGATSFQYKYIIIPADVDCIDASVIHEMGHVLDGWKYTNTDEWREIYEAEKGKYIREYARTNRFEGFACAYMEYIINRESFENRCPRTCEFLERALNNIELEN